MNKNKQNPRSEKDKTAPDLRVENLVVQREGKELLKGVTLQFESGKIYALMGPNGAGKSTLLYTIMGHPECRVVKGKIFYDGKEITSISTDLRAKQGLFLSFQNPIEIPGVRLSHFLRTVVNTQREGRGEKPLSVPEFAQVLKEKLSLLGLDETFARRSLNEGFSGGEKKRAEILQLALLEPRFVFLDETDSGLDIDGMKTVAQMLHRLQKETKMTIVIITHYKRFLDYLRPDQVYVLQDGKVVNEGGASLIERIETEGFGDIKHAKSNAKEIKNKSNVQSNSKAQK
ncbi:Fe-S cluster assembly ATPase SufC [Candidatus Woesearchaeota archaeon]|nr:Fe-S cluster assembly ATPase SufC [Candidatus Woesearchaeota archaeon]